METNPSESKSRRTDGGSRGDGNATERIKDASREVSAGAREHARARIEAGKDSALRAAEDARRALDDAGERLSEEGHETLAQATFALSERMRTLAAYVESHSLNELSQEARRMARKSPALMVAGGVALGFAASRFFKASPERGAVSSSRSAASPADGAATGIDALGGDRLEPAPGRNIPSGGDAHE